MKNKLLPVLFLFSASVAYSQTVTTVVKATLPASQLPESSGLVYKGNTKIWSHNDSGNSPTLFKIDSAGTLLKSLTITGGSNNDWEDITTDPQGNMYIGDFGNNLNNRTNLNILKISNPDNVTGTSIAAQKIRFNYPDQTAFPPDSGNWNFDCEAMIHFGDSIYIFTKNTAIASKSSHYSKLYSLPDQPGIYTAHFIDSVYTYYRIAGAALNPSQNALALITTGHVLLFQGWTGTNFFNGTHQTITLSQSSQTEGISFIDDNHLYMTDEKNSSDGKLYKLDLSPFITTTAAVSFNIPADNTVTLLPNPTTGVLIVNLDAINFSSGNMNIFTAAGTLVKQAPVSVATRKASATTLDLTNGMYYVQIDLNGNEKLVEVMMVQH